MILICFSQMSREIDICHTSVGYFDGLLCKVSAQITCYFSVMLFVLLIYSISRYITLCLFHNSFSRHSVVHILLITAYCH